jgi:hypothetical protein
MRPVDIGPVGRALGHGDRRPTFHFPTRNPRIYVDNVYYRHYCPDPGPFYGSSVVFPSLYTFYVGVPTYIYSQDVVVVDRRSPRVVEIDDDDVDYYYLSPSSKGSLKDAQEDLRQAWVLGDVDLILKHLRSDRKVDVFLRGKYSYSIEAEDYRDMTKDALETIRTVSFEWVRSDRRSDTEVALMARHTFEDKDGERRSVYVSYTLEKYHGSWWVTEVGSAQSVDEIERGD